MFLFKKIAKAAKRIGSADANYKEYTIKAQALRDKDQCSVAVKVLKDLNLVAERIVNACQ